MADPVDITNVRFTLALTGEYAGLETDGEITRLLDMYPNDWRLAAAAIADALAARAIHDPSSFSAAGKLSVSWTDRASSWRSTASSLRKQVMIDTEAAAKRGMVSITTLRRAGIIADEPEYTRTRSYKTL